MMYTLFGGVLNGCYGLCRNYGLAIILFTFLSKLVLAPVSVWVQKNSIKMVKMQPELNFIKAKFFGDKDTIAEEEAKVYKRERYNPMASIIPLAIQLVLLVGVIEAIKGGMSEAGIDMAFLGTDLSAVPSEQGGLLILSPILAGLSAWVLCLVQNSQNVLQSEQGAAGKYGTMAFSVGLSLYLGWFVPVGVAVYWIASNLMAIAQLFLLNWIINPRSYIDYEQLEKSKQALAELEHLGDTGEDRQTARKNKKREREDYKRFFSVTNKHIVFYSESGGFYKYYRGMIEYILEHTNLTIHYITGDPNDPIFQLSQTQPKIRPYYIGEKRLITLMMRMESDLVVMTMPDLENFHIKRSYVRKDIEYIYIPHGISSLNMMMRTGSMDHYDTIFCVGAHQKEEIRRTEEVYGLPPKKLIDWGYCLLDEMRAGYQALPEKAGQGPKTILIAPSWQPDNIVDNCLEDILDALKDQDYQITVRPHPQHVRHKREYMEGLKQKYQNAPNITIQTDFSSNSTVFEADLLISDWSGIAYEYAFTTCKPVLFINTPMKVMNPEYEKIGVPPMNITLRDEIGCSVDLKDIGQVGQKVQMLLQHREDYQEKIDRLVRAHVYNLGDSARVGALYMINSVQEKIKARKEIK